MGAGRGHGRLVAICGIDGSGKATQTALLARRAEAEGLSVRCISFPRYGEGFFADLIERYLRGEFASEAAAVSPYLAALPYACDRWEAAPQLRQWLSEGCLVVCNRYVSANLAHQGCKLEEPAARRTFYEWIERLEYGVFGLPRPDLHVLLEVSPEGAGRLIRRRAEAEGGSRKGDIHEQDPEHLRATAAVYRELAGGAASQWAVIECEDAGALLAPEQIAERVWAAVGGAVYTERQ